MNAGTIRELNALAQADAEQWLLACCAAPLWARQVAAGRPYADLPALLVAARAHWADAGEAERLAAFGAHPLIGDVELLRARYAAPDDRANAEQGQVLGADDAVLQSLAARNRDYFERHGFIFIVFASGKNAAQMLALLEERLPRSRQQELDAAAAEQMKITELRINDQLGNSRR